MRNVLVSLLLLLVSAAVAVSLFSYSPADPSVFHPTEARVIANRFGWIGAQTAGWLMGFFGKGVLWIPVTLFLTSLFRFGKRHPLVLVRTMAGGGLLAATTCVLTTMLMPPAEDVAIQHSAGGVLGFRLTGLALFYTGYAGTLLLVVSGLVIGFFLLTGISPLALARMIRKRPALPTAVKGRPTPDINHPQLRSPRTSKKKSPSPPEPSDASVEMPPPDIPPMKPALVLPADQPKSKAPHALSATTGSKHFTLPIFDFLNDPAPSDMKTDQEELLHQAELLTAKLENFGVKGRVAAITPGPVITTFEYEPAPGVKINKIVSLSDDLALALKALSIRIVAPIPGKSVIGIEIPNAIRQIVQFKEIVTSPAFAKSRSVLTICLGKDIVGKPVVAELDRMPHLLIAGATGTGKSVGLNSMICSMLYKSTPEQVKLIMIDPKRIELSLYDGIPHLITPVVTDVKKATNALFWAVREMERRYELLSEHKCRNINQYNQKAGKTKGSEESGSSTGSRLPYIVIIIDELADLMMVASRDVEVALTRLAQMARASGIHLILATQRPSVDVLTGIIKANFPTRLTFQVSSKTDSRTILDCNGAESLLGNGDMLFLPPGTAKLQRIHGSYISEEEVGRITDFLRTQMPPDYIDEVTEAPQRVGEASGEEDYDERYDDAVALVTRTRQASISMIQRHLRIGYNRAARIIETMEKEGIIGPSDGVKPREVLVKSYEGMP